MATARDVASRPEPAHLPGIAGTALASDPVLSFTTDKTGRYVIVDKMSGEQFTSGMDDDPRTPRDVAYVGRLRYSSGSMLLIAGIHAIGSVGAIHYLSTHDAEIYADVGDGCWSTVIGSQHDEISIIESEIACPPRRH